jgi:hypothetical protein
MKIEARTETVPPKLTVEYPTAEELRAFSARCNALGDAVKSSRGFMGVAAVRAAIDLDYLARIVDADPVKQLGQWQLVIQATVPEKPAKKAKPKAKR